MAAMTVEPSPAPEPGPVGGPLPPFAADASTAPLGRSVRLGWSAIGIAIILVVVGWLIGLGSQALQVAAAKGRAKVGNPVTFDAAGGKTYAITLIPEPTTGDFVEDRIGQLDCSVAHPDGSTDDLDVSTATVRSSNAAGIFAADFEGRGGTTTVRCAWGGPSDLGGFYAVARTHKATRYVGTGLLVGGIVLGIAGVGLLVRGYKARPEVQAIMDGAADG
jgi:hypothetical protein